MSVKPTVLDIARAVARLDEHAYMPAKDFKRIEGAEWTREDMRRSVANNLSFHLRHHYPSSLRRVTTRDVSVAMAVSGASPFTVSQHARAIAAMIRNNVSGGW